MRNTAYVLVGFVVLAAAGTPAVANDREAALAPIRRAIKATGGQDKLDRHNAITWKEKGFYHGMGEPIAYEGDYAVQWPGQFRMHIRGLFTIVVNRDKGWYRDRDGTRELTEEDLAEQLEVHYAGWVTTLLPLESSKFQLSRLNRRKIDDRRADCVKVTRAGHRSVWLFFDADSGLLIKSEYRAKEDPRKDKTLKEEVYYYNYQDVDGVKIPLKIVIHRDGKPFVEAENLEVKAVGKLDDSVFDKP